MLETEKQPYGVSRLVVFSDGVFGFAITLMLPRSILLTQ